MKTMHPVDFGPLTECPPEWWDNWDLLRFDAIVQSVDDDSVTLVTAIDTTIIMPRSVFERRDCLPKPGLAVSFDVKCGWFGRYVSRLMVGHRFAHLSEELP